MSKKIAMLEEEILLIQKALQAFKIVDDTLRLTGEEKVLFKALEAKKYLDDQYNELVRLYDKLIRN